jgi:hypothetical protein
MAARENLLRAELRLPISLIERATKSPSKTPQLTSKKPQLHHKKPARNHHFSQKPPVKTPLHQREKKTEKRSHTKEIKLLE